MPTMVYTKDKWVNLFPNNPDFEIVSPVVYNLGAALTGLLRINEDEAGRLYDSLIRIFLNAKAGRLTDEDNKSIAKTIEKINALNPYLNFYTVILTGVLFSVIRGKPYDMAPVFVKLPRTHEVYDRYQERFESDAENPDAILAPYYKREYLESRPEQQKILMLRSVNNILYIRESVLLDINEKKAAVESALRLLSDDSGKPLGMQSIFAIESMREKNGDSAPYFIGSEFKVVYAAFKNGKKAEEVSISSFTDGEDMEIHGLYSLDWIDDLIRFELIKMLEQGVTVKKCENCGSLFAPSGRVDTVYCGDLFEDTNKSCSEIGALKKYKSKEASHPAFVAFNKAYKRNNSRVRNGKMSKDDFSNWLEGAKEKREKCLNGSLPYEEFSKWLGNK